MISIVTEVYYTARQLEATLPELVVNIGNTTNNGLKMGSEIILHYPVDIGVQDVLQPQYQLPSIQPLNPKPLRP